MNETLSQKKESRLTRCAGCKVTFTYKYPSVLTKGANLIINTSCPFCSLNIQVDLSPYAKDKIISYKSTDASVTKIDVVIFDLPTELPTTIRE